MILCDRCGKRISKRKTGYVAKIEVYASADPPKITPRDLRRDHSKEIAKLLKQCEEMPEEELMRDVYVKFEFNLCRPCQRIYLSNPLMR